MTNTTTPSAPASSTPEETLLAAAGATDGAPQGGRVKLEELTHDPAFTPRTGTAKGHVQELARKLRQGTDLDPIKVWRCPRTGRLVILDGRHRAAAYQLIGATDIPAELFTGDRNAARLEAARGNSKAAFPWTTQECTRYAWGLVIDGVGSKRQISLASSVSIGTVTAMRKRLAELEEAGQVPSGNWWRDRNGHKLDGQAPEESDAVKQARVEKVRDYLHSIDTRFKLEFGSRPSMEEMGKAMRWYLGIPRFNLMVSCGLLEDEDEFSTDPSKHPLAPVPMDPNADF